MFDSHILSVNIILLAIGVVYKINRHETKYTTFFNVKTIRTFIITDYSLANCTNVHTSYNVSVFYPVC